MSLLSDFLLKNGVDASLPEIRGRNKVRWAAVERVTHGVRLYVMQNGPVSTLDIGEALKSLPDNVREGWLDHPTYRPSITRFSHVSHNPLLVGGKVKAVGFRNAVADRIRKMYGSDVDVGISGGEYSRGLSDADLILYRRKGQMSEYLDEVLESTVKIFATLKKGRAIAADF